MTTFAIMWTHKSEAWLMAKRWNRTDALAWWISNVDDAFLVANPPMQPLNDVRKIFLAGPTDSTEEELPSHESFATAAFTRAKRNNSPEMLFNDPRWVHSLLYSKGWNRFSDRFDDIAHVSYVEIKNRRNQIPAELLSTYATRIVLRNVHRMSSPRAFAEELLDPSDGGGSVFELGSRYEYQVSLEEIVIDTVVLGKSNEYLHRLLSQNRSTLVERLEAVINSRGRRADRLFSSSIFIYDSSLSNPEAAFFVRWLMVTNAGQQNQLVEIAPTPTCEVCKTNSDVATQQGNGYLREWMIPLCASLLDDGANATHRQFVETYGLPQNDRTRPGDVNAYRFFAREMFGTRKPDEVPIVRSGIIGVLSFAVHQEVAEVLHHSHSLGMS